MGKKRRGRPKLPAKDRQAITITVRVSKADRKAFAGAAKESGQKLSDWVRENLLAVVKRSTINNRKVEESNPPAADTASP
jgi:predicted HicB family RNase H-like nuclease